MKKEITFIKNLQFGLFDTDRGEFMFNYGTELDTGLGTVTKVDTDEEFRVIKEKHDEETGNIKSVVIELNDATRLQQGEGSDV